MMMMIGTARCTLNDHTAAVATAPNFIFYHQECYRGLILSVKINIYELKTYGNVQVILQ